MPIFSFKFLRDLIRVKSGEADTSNVSDQALNQFAIIGLQDWFREVMPYDGIWFFPYSSQVNPPLDFGPGATPGGYVWSTDCYEAEEIAYRDVGQPQRWIPIFPMEPSNVIYAPEEADVVSGSGSRAYGMKRGNILYVKGVPDIATDPPLVRVFGKRGPTLPELQPDGSFAPVDDEAEIDMPVQYRSHLLDRVRAEVRDMRGDFEGYSAMMARFDFNTAKARGRYPKNGLRQGLRTMKMSGDYGSAGVDGISRRGFGW